MLKNGKNQNTSSSEDPVPNARGAESSGSGSSASANSIPAISIPKGGGAIRGIGEKFAANPVTGTAALTVPLATSPGRSGFGPQLSLSYDSGAGNGPFGFGWSLSLPAITRKTDKGLPRYWDSEESDVFILSGSEDLVPVSVEVNGEWQRETLPTRTLGGENYRVQRYRPRIEGLFARIERWTNLNTAESHWRSITRDNVTTLYGKDDNSRIFAPADANQPKREFSWLICQSHDDKGNVLVYEYAPENNQNVDHTQANERNRTRKANRYLKRIKYGNKDPYLAQPNLLQTEWMFEVVFDYEEGHYEEVPLNPLLTEAEQHRFVLASASTAAPWAVRPDPFSSYRSGFEVRTYRRCKRVLMFHHFDELAAEPYLVRSTEIEYADFDYSVPSSIEEELAHQGSSRFGSFVRSITQSGFVRDDTQAVLERDGVEYVTYLRKSLPPLELEYSKAKIQEDVRELDEASLENLPVGLDGSTYQWVDLNGEGVSGILTEQADAWFYKSNLGDGHFGPLEVVALKPSLANLGGGSQQLIDLAGDGQLDLVTFAGPSPGFYERTPDEDWESFRTFRTLPNIRWDDPNLRFVDLTGDGHADILISEDDVFTWYPSLAEEGFDAAGHVRKPLDEERGPRLVLADSTQSIYLADMCGDGLTALVRIRNGEVCYWPNLGYGRFGSKVTMDDAPQFENPDQFENRRIRVSDIDGSGTSDIIYLSREGARVYFNQAGNRWSEPRSLSRFPHVDNLASVMTADLLGNGTACLVWSSPLPADRRRPVRYIDLMGGQKPHLLVSSINNLGAETHIHYKSSTKFYLDDKASGTPWITKLSFPVQVVERVETYDRVSGNRFVTRYAYHHGYFDDVEREFRGFGMVEQRDTEEFAALNSMQQLPAGTNVEESSHVPPVLTRTWFHTGVFLRRDHVSDFFAGMLDKDDVGEYYREPGLTDAQARELLLDDTMIPAGMTIDEERECCRALKGSMLHQEVYALDGTAKEKYPYSVTEQNFTVRRVQPQGDNRHSIFFSHARESLSYHYERDPSDPRVAHKLILEVDDFNNVLKSASINYGRRQNILVVDGFGGTAEVSNPGLAVLSLPEQSMQAMMLITYIENSFTNAVAEDDVYRAPAPCETRTYELNGLALSAGRSRFSLTEILSAGSGAVLIAYEQTPAAGVQQRRVIEHVRTLYRRNNLTGPLPLGQLQSLALPFESYKLAFTPSLLTTIYAGRVTDAMLSEGGYVHSDGDANWWVPSGRVFYSSNPGDPANQELIHAQAHFFLPHRYRDPFHTNVLSTETFITYDLYDLLMQQTRDALGNLTTVGERDAADNLVAAGHDYRKLQPRLVMGPNRNRTAIAFDALGMVVGTALMGKPEGGSLVGDQLSAAFSTNLTQAEIDQFVANPKGLMATSLLGDATTRIIYDLTSYRRPPLLKSPAFAATLARETHSSDALPSGGLKIQANFSYSDGYGREIQKKIQAEAGPIPMRDLIGKIVVDAGGQPTMTATDVSPRWVGSGWTVFNNKGKPVQQYEPFFTDTHRFEFEARIGVSPVIFYDPVERVVATLHPDHAWVKVVFDPWQQTSWDLNDTVLSDPQNDPDVGDFFRRRPNADYLPTWYAARQSGALGQEQQASAHKAAVHASTPTIAHFDTLGRAFLTVAHNKFKRSATPAADPPTEEFHRTRIVFDIEGNQREVIDANNRVVMRYDYGIAGPEEDKKRGRGNRCIHQSSMDGGERWTLSDVAGNPIRVWDSRAQIFRTEYDPLRRPLRSFVVEADASNPNQELMVEFLVYGEQHPEDQMRNLRGRLFLHCDQAGVATTEAHDFKGNVLRTSQRLALEYKQALDWSTVNAALPTMPAKLDPHILEAALAPFLEDENFSTSTNYDALNRPVNLTTPDHSVMRPIYNEANLLERVEANLRGAQASGELVWTSYVTNIDYDAKGQRTLIAFGNGVTTKYRYDRETFRLTRLTSTRPATFPVNERVVQDLGYTYDPIGNITHIADDADIQNVVFFRNQRVEPSADFEYDAIYRLIEATGREHLGQSAGGASEPPAQPGNTDAPRVNLPHPGGNEMGNYLEGYEYDPVGNILTMIHQAQSGGWTRHYAYTQASLLEPAKTNNRLSATSLPGDNSLGPYSAKYSYDEHGNMIAMSHLPSMVWDHHDQLHATSQQVVVGGGSPETTYYVYDAAGQRVRKITENQAVAGATPSRKQERIYLGGLEIYREYGGIGGTITLERETLQIKDDKQHIAQVETRTAGSDPGPAQLTRFQFGNHLRSASLELDHQAQIISYEEYYPYGSTSYQAVRSQTETGKRYRYSGKERDEESGLYYHGARYYASWLGRWLSCDPLVFSPLRPGQESPQGVHPESSPYCGMSNNPVMRHDLDGRQDTAYTRYLDRKFATADGASEVIQNNQEILSSPRVIGVIQTVGSVFELVGAAALLLTPEPTMATKVAGVALGAHGIDDLQAGVRTLWTGEVKKTVTHQAAAATAETLGASPEAAEKWGTGADIVAGVGPGIVGGIAKRGTIKMLEKSSLQEANFAQKTFRETFSETGKFAGKTVDDVAAGLRSGSLKPSDVPIEYIVRDGKPLILNTRSAQALQKAGIPRSQWKPVNMTGNPAAEARLTGQLQRNKLTNQGTPTVKPTGKD